MQDPNATYVLYPAKENREVRVIYGIVSPESIEHRDEALHRKLVAERIDQVGWRAEDLHATLAESGDFYFGEMAQVLMYQAALKPTSSTKPPATPPGSPTRPQPPDTAEHPTSTSWETSTGTTEPTS